MKILFDIIRFQEFIFNCLSYYLYRAINLRCLKDNFFAPKKADTLDNSPYGEIGRHDGFRNHCFKRVSSSLTKGTNKVFNNLYSLSLW